MRFIAMLWLVTAGAGCSYAILQERQEKLNLLKEMEYSLEKLAYFMYQWKMPVEEAFHHVAEEEYGMLRVFYQKLTEELDRRKAGNLGVLWKEKSNLIWQNWKLSKNLETLWNSLFLHMPMEPERLYTTLRQKTEEIAEVRRELQEKYKGEQKLVWTLGVSASVFLCLILW